MNELKCKECGAVLEMGKKECPSCGCPIEEGKNEQLKVDKTEIIKKFNVTSIVSLILGIVIIIMGFTVMNKEVKVDTYSANHYETEKLTFGADFYTEIYGPSDIIVDELNDINGGVELLSESMNTIANVIYYPVGMMIVALGLGVVAVSCNHIKKETI